MEAVLQRTQRPWCILVDPGSQSAWQGEPGTAALQTVAVNLPETCKRTTVVGVREPAADAQTIRPDADLLLVAGAGWTKKQADGQAHVKDAETILRECLKLARASLGSSKIAGGFGRRRAGRAFLPDPHESDRPDRLHPAAPKGSVHLLPWRRAAHGRLALHQ